ncbi:MAG: hypothetical protein NTW95_07065, partial [Candidatus Aminicenantes bacterium]|nr:hypothetical protein [Candidatus Aminicenantes bacterium]
MGTKINKNNLWTLAYSFGIGLIFCAMFFLVWARDFRKIIKKIEIGPLNSAGFTQSEFFLDEVDQKAYIVETILKRIPDQPIIINYFLNGIQINSLQVKKKWFFFMIPANLLCPGTNYFRIRIRGQDSTVIKTIRLKNVYGYSRGILSAYVVPAENSRYSGIRNKWGALLLFLLFFLLSFWGYWLATHAAISRPVFLDWNLIVPLLFGLLLIGNAFFRYKILLETETIILLLTLFFGWLFRDRIFGNEVLMVKFAAALVVIYFIFSIVQYAVDIPQVDDYDNILGSMNQLYQSQNFTEVGSILFAQHNEHRLVFNRMVSMAMLKIFRRIDFRWLIFIGNLAIFVLIWIIFRIYRCDEKKFFYFSPAIFLIFQPLYDSFVWAMAALSNFYALAFAALCFYFLQKKTPGA